MGLGGDRQTKPLRRISCWKFGAMDTLYARTAVNRLVHPCVVVAGLLALGSGQVHAAQTQGPNALALRDTVLSNGLTVLVAENHNVPLATVALAVRAGAADQDPTERGMAHLLEHLLFRSYGREPTDFARRASDLHAMYNATTGPNGTVYELTLPADELEGGVRLLADLVDGVRVRSRELDMERRVVLDELARTAAEPESLLRRSVQAAFWGDLWHEADVAGDSTSLRRITPDGVQNFFLEHYRADNAALVVSGAADFDQIVEWAGERFEDWQDGTTTERAGNAPRQPNVRTVLVMSAAPVLEATVMVQMAAPGSEDRSGLDVLSALQEVLNGTGSTFQRRFVDQGPFTSLEVELHPRRGSSTIVFSGQTGLADAPEAAASLVVELGRLELMIDDSSPALERARSRHLLTRALTFERAGLLAGYIGNLWVWTGDRGSVADLSIPPELPGRALKDAAQRWVSGAPKVIGVLVPEDHLEAVVNRLQGGAP